MMKFLVIIFWVTAGLQISAQSLKAQIEARLKEDNKYSEINTSILNPQVFVDYEITSFQISIPFAGSQTEITRSIFVTLKNGKKSIDEHLNDNFNLKSGNLIHGTVVNAIQVNQSLVILSEEIIAFPYSKRKHYHAYRLDLDNNSLQKLPLEALGYRNEKCLNENKELKYELYQEGESVKLRQTVTTIQYEDCEPKKRERITIQYFDPERKQFVNEKNVFTLETDRKIKLEGTTWQVKEEHINNTLQKRNSIYEFDELGKIRLWTRNYDAMTMSSEFIGTYDLSQKNATIQYAYDGMGITYTGNIFQNDTMLLWESIGIGDEQLFRLSFNANRAIFNENKQVVTELMNKGWQPDIYSYINCLYNNRVDLIKIFLQNGFDPHQYVKMYAGDSIMTGSPLFLTVLTGNLEALKLMIDSGADIYDYRKNHRHVDIFEFAQRVGNQHIIDFLLPYRERIKDYFFPENNRTKLYSWVRDFYNIPDDKGLLDVSWFHEEADILYYNVSASLCEQNMRCSVDEDIVVYYFKDEEGNWITSGEEPDFPHRVPGEADTIFELGGKKYMSYTLREVNSERARMEYGLRMLNTETGVFEKTNLSYSYYEKMGMCASERNIYRFRPLNNSDKKLEVVKTFKNYVNCKETTSSDSKFIYYWSERQSKFIETLD